MVLVCIQTQGPLTFVCFDICVLSFPLAEFHCTSHNEHSLQGRCRLDSRKDFC